MALESPNCYVCDHHTLCYARRHVDDLLEHSGLFNEDWQQLFVTLAKVCNRYKHAHLFQEPVGVYYQTDSKHPGERRRYCECGEWQPADSKPRNFCTASVDGKHSWALGGIASCEHCGRKNS